MASDHLVKMMGGKELHMDWYFDLTFQKCNCTFASAYDSIQPFFVPENENWPFWVIIYESFGHEIYLVDNVVNGRCIETSSAGNITQFWTLFIFIQYFELGFHQKRFAFHWSRFWIFRFLFLQKILKIFEKKNKIRTFGKSCPFLGGERSGCSGSRAITEVCWICFLAKSFSFLISTYSAFKFLRNYLGNFLAFSVRDFLMRFFWISHVR